MAHSKYQYLQDIISEDAKVDCSVFVYADRISIRAKSYADFVLARKAIIGRVTLPIIFDFLPQLAE